MSVHFLPGVGLVLEGRGATTPPPPPSLAHVTTLLSRIFLEPKTGKSRHQEILAEYKGVCYNYLSVIVVNITSVIKVPQSYYYFVFFNFSEGLTFFFSIQIKNIDFLTLKCKYRKE